MQEAIEKSAILLEAYHYIRRFSGKIVVVKIGGSIMDSPDTLNRLLDDLAFLNAVGLRPVLVHGGGKRISDEMKKAGLQAQFVQGRRYTDERTLTIAEHVLCRSINADIVDYLDDKNHPAMGLHSLSSCALFGKRLFLAGEDGRQIDVGLVGEVDRVNADLLTALVEAEYIPVIAPIARDAGGGKLNINADSAAGQVAAALKAEKLVLVSDTHGIRTGETDDTLASSLTKAEVEQLIDDGVVDGGMLPKVDAAFTSLEAGVRKAHIIDGQIPHSLLLEIFSRDGSGTEITLEPQLQEATP